MSSIDMAGMYPFKGTNISCSTSYTTNHQAGPGKPDDIAKMAVVLASDDASWMTGALVSVDGGYVAR